MRTTIILILLAAFLIPARAAVRPHLLVETNGALVAPSAFFTANQSAITALSSGVYQPLDSDLTAFAGISGVSGDIIYHNGSTWVRLPKGTDGQSLQLSSGFPTWATVVGGGGVGDVTLAGTNAFTGPNSFTGVTTLDGSVYINGATTISNQLTFKATGGSGDARLKWTGNKMLLANDTEISSLRTAGSDVAFGTFFAGPVQSYAVRADGMISWSDGTNAASAVFGPRRIEDRMNGVVRLSGGLGITERSAPPTPENNTGTIWLESATTKSIKVSWPDGTSSAIGSGGGGDVTLAGTNLFTGPNTFGGATVVSNLTVPGTLAVGSISSSSPLGMSIGGTGGTNAESARASLGVTYDVDVMAYRLGLLQAALALTADGHMVYHNGTLVTNLASTSAGRALLTAASASAQWNNYLLAVASTNGGYDSTSWNGVTDRLVTLDQFRDAINALPGGSNAITSVTAPLSLTNGVLSIDTTGLGGGGGGVTWIVNEPLGSWYGRDATTNWPLLSVTISSNNLPTVSGQYLFGNVSGILSNLSGGSATVYYNADVNGVRVFRDSYSVAGTIPARGRPYIGDFYLVYETATTASLIHLGSHATSTNPDIGGSGDISGNNTAFTFIATNIVVNWSSNITLALGFECDASTSTNSALGLRKVSASLLKYSAGTGGGITADGTTVTNIVSSASITNTVAGGQTTLSIRDSGVSAGTYSNLVAAIGADGRVTSATSATNLVLSTLSAGTVTATSVAGDGSSLTNLNASSVASGTLAAARLPTSGVSAGSYTNPTVTVDTYGRITAAVNGTAGGGSSVFVNGSSVTDPNFATGPYATVSAASVTNITVQPTRVPVSSITFASTNSIDLTVSQKFTLLVTNDTTFASGTISNGVSVLVLLTADSTARNLTWPSGWTFLNVPAPTQLAASKTAILALETFGTAATNVYASYSAQP